MIAKDFDEKICRRHAFSQCVYDLWELPHAADVQISLCTFVTDWKLYRGMVTRFMDKGFKENCEYVYVDNSEGNKCSAFSGINAFLNRANGQIVIMLHQDVHPIDDFEAFRAALSAVNEMDPNWAVLGNAGFDGSFKSIRYLSSSTGYQQIVGNRSTPVESLDENFLIFNMPTRPSVSYDLDSFHLYGTDAVQIAKLRGLKSYVIDYHVDHFGSANLDSTFLKTIQLIEEKFSFKRRWFTIKTPVSYVAMGGPSLKAWQHKKRLERFIRTGQKRSSFSEFRKKVSRHVRSFRLNLSGGKLSFKGKEYFVPLYAPTSSIRALAQGTYEVEERYFVNSYVDCNVPVVELGGSYGVVSGQIAKRLGGRQKHIIVEAIPDLVPIIKKNIGGLLGQDTFIHNAALSYSGQFVEFEVKHSVHSSRISSGRQLGESGHVINVPTVTLKNLLSTYEVDGDYCLVCDIEGAEFELFKNEPEALKRCVLAIVEFHPAVFSEMRKSTIEFFELIEASGLTIIERRGSVVVAKRA
jgi:FkbM family methyltransferase